MFCTMYMGVCFKWVTFQHFCLILKYTVLLYVLVHYKINVNQQYVKCQFLSRKCKLIKKDWKPFSIFSVRYTIILNYLIHMLRYEFCRNILRRGDNVHVLSWFDLLYLTTPCISILVAMRWLTLDSFHPTIFGLW